MAIVPAPALRQFADENLAIEIGAEVYPRLVQRLEGKNGLFLQIEGPINDRCIPPLAAERFQIVLGLVRAWRPIAGEREDEVRPAIGNGPIRGDKGGMLLQIGPAIDYSTFPGEVRAFGRQSAAAVRASESLRNALWLNGRRDRNAADYYMIYEFAMHDLGGTKGVMQALRVSKNDLERLTQSANNLTPLEGGRHARGTGEAEWDLPRQREFIAGFLRGWISHCAYAFPPT